MAIDMDYDLDRWVYVPNLFPGVVRRRGGGRMPSRAFGGEGRTAAPAELVDWLRAYLVGAVRSNRSGTIRFVHLPNITAPHAIVDVYDMPHRDDVALVDLTHEKQGPAVREPEVVPFDSGISERGSNPPGGCAPRPTRSSGRPTGCGEPPSATSS
jgi:hypothetical protein